METSAVKRLSLRELMVLARERLGARAVALKTREELVQALFGGEPARGPAAAPPRTAAPPPRVVVTRDFFLTAP
jgi:hypothetical protein